MGEVVRRRAAQLGAPSRVQAVFNDAYGDLPMRQRTSLVSSWVDSAPNQLSVVSAFVDDLRLASHAAKVERAMTTLEHDGGHTLLSSNWLAADSSKQTTLEFGDVRLGLYDALLHRPDDSRLGVGLALQIAGLLEEAAAHPVGQIAWAG